MSTRLEFIIEKAMMRKGYSYTSDVAVEVTADGDLEFSSKMQTGSGTMNVTFTLTKSDMAELFEYLRIRGHSAGTPPAIT